MDEPLRRTSRRIREKQNQEKKQILSPKCLTFRSEVKNTRKAVKRKVKTSLVEHLSTNCVCEHVYWLLHIILEKWPWGRRKCSRDTSRQRQRIFSSKYKRYTITFTAKMSTFHLNGKIHLFFVISNRVIVRVCLNMSWSDWRISDRTRPSSIPWNWLR